jgi:hypothetical protein
LSCLIVLLPQIFSLLVAKGGAMKRFIFLSFAFLGWAFYELSGGADFQPRVANTTVEAVVATATAIPQPQTQPQTRPVKAVALVARPAIAQVKPQPANSDAVLLPHAVAAVLTDATASTSNLDQIRAGLAQPLLLASLEQGVAGLSAAPVVAADAAVGANWTPPEADIREITGTRVNMRDGPGTIYPVISRLTIGHEVEVLGDSGTGWLRLRILPEQQTGWISASLVSKDSR